MVINSTTRTRIDALINDYRRVAADHPEALEQIAQQFGGGAA